MSHIWEDLVSLKSSEEPDFKILDRARNYITGDTQAHYWNHLDLAQAVEIDDAPLPAIDDREGYYGTNHYSYWASGYQDMQLLLQACEQHGVPVSRYLDIGCASGRVLRHFAFQQPAIEPIGADINRLHVEWCNRHLPQRCKVFHNSSIPSLALADNSVDAITAYSVFTHIEAFESAWLMEIARILRPGGLAWLTVHTEHTLKSMDETWPLWGPVMTHPDAARRLGADRTFGGDRLVLRWHSERSYASNTFYKEDYIRKVWSRFLDIAEFRYRCPVYQDVVILRKPLQ